MLAPGRDAPRGGMADYDRGATEIESVAYVLGPLTKIGAWPNLALSHSCPFCSRRNNGIPAKSYGGRGASSASRSVASLSGRALARLYYDTEGVLLEGWIGGPGPRLLAWTPGITSHSYLNGNSAKLDRRSHTPAPCLSLHPQGPRFSDSRGGGVSTPPQPCQAGQRRVRVAHWAQ